MTEGDIIVSFYRGELKPGDEFILTTKNEEYTNPHKVKLIVSENGLWLSCHWLNRKGHIVNRPFELMMNNLKQKGYKKQ